MKVVLRCCFIVVLALSVTPNRAFGQLITYDSFSAVDRLIDGNKWGGFEGEFRGTEAERRIDAGKLRLTYRAFGNLVAATPTGAFFSDFGLFHPNPNVVSIFQAQVGVIDFDAVACPGNATPTAVVAGLRGGFFNTGSPVPQTETNDVIAWIFLVRRSNALVDTVAVEAQMFRCANALCTQVNSLQNRSLGTVACPGRFCPPVILRITWEPAANRFRFLRVGVPEQIVPYTLADALPATRPFKVLDILPSVATCTPAAGRKRASMDALFDNVVVNTPPASSADAGLDEVDLGGLPIP